MIGRLFAVAAVIIALIHHPKEKSMTDHTETGEFSLEEIRRINSAALHSGNLAYNLIRSDEAAGTDRLEQEITIAILRWIDFSVNPGHFPEFDTHGASTEMWAKLLALPNDGRRGTSLSDYICEFGKPAAVELIQRHERFTSTQA